METGLLHHELTGFPPGFPTRSAAHISERQLARTLNSVVAAALPSVFGWLAVLAMLVLAGWIAFLPGQVQPARLDLLWLTAGVLLSLRVLTWFAKIPDGCAHSLVALVAALLLANLFLEFHLELNPAPTTLLILLLIGAANLLLDTIWFICIVLATLAGWAHFAIAAGQPAVWTRPGFALAGGVAIAGLMFRSRLRAQRLHLSEVARRAELDQALDTARQYEEQFRQLSSAAFEALIIYDHGRILQANQAAATLFGFALPDLIGSRVLDLFPSAQLHTISHSLEFGNFKSFEAEGARKDGTLFPVELIGKAMTWQDRTVRVIAVRDLSTLKATELQLAQEKLMRDRQYRRQSALADLELTMDQPHELKPTLQRIAELAVWQLPASEAGVFLHETENGTFALSASSAATVCVRPRFARTEKLPLALTLPLDNREALSVTDATQDVFGIRQIFPHAELGAYVVLPMLSEMRIVGLMFVLHAQPRPFTPEDLAFLENLAGRAAVAVFKLRSFEKLRRANEQLEQQRAELKSKNTELTGTKDAAEAAARAKTQFLDNMSHEFRTPLNGILGMAHLLSQADLDSDQRESMQLLQDSAEHLLAIVNDTLDLSQLEAGRLALQLEDFDAREIVAELINKFSPVAVRKNLSLASSFPEGLPTRWRGDASRLQRVLGHLLDNAIKFTERGGVHLQIRAQDQKPDAVTIRFEIRDTGIGIPVEAQADLFRPFHQADNSRTRQFGGAGLGLALCKRLVELMGGQIGVESRAGDGASFWFTAKFSNATSETTPRQPG
ncbi:MAG: PAS domain S-box protein [Verrucomicrobia bacterium]|nr:PAS domain S-box protein [Verrucomicrobiota bacterium]